MRLSRGDDLTSPMVRISSLKHHLLSSFSFCPHCFSCILFSFTSMPLLQLSQGHCQYFFPSLFLSPSLLFPITPTVLRPHLSFFHLGRIEREGRAALSLPKTLPPHHFLLIWFEGSTHLPLPPPFPPLLRLPVFLLTFPEKSKFTPPPKKN